MHPQPFTQPHSTPTHVHSPRTNTNGNGRSSTYTVSILCLHPGVGGAGELVRPVWRPPCGGVEVHVVGVGFESERLAGVAVGGGRGQVDRFVLVLLLAVALWGRQVHSVAVVVLPVGFVVKWLCVLGEGTMMWFIITVMPVFCFSVTFFSSLIGFWSNFRLQISHKRNNYRLVMIFTAFFCPTTCPKPTNIQFIIMENQQILTFVAGTNPTLFFFLQTEMND